MAGFLEITETPKEAELLNLVESTADELAPVEYEHYISRPSGPSRQVKDGLYKAGLYNLHKEIGLGEELANMKLMTRAAARLAKIGLSPVLLLLSHSLQASLVISRSRGGAESLQRALRRGGSESLLAYVGPPFASAVYGHDDRGTDLEIAPQPIFNAVDADAFVVLARDRSEDRWAVFVLDKEQVEVLDRMESRMGLLSTDLAIVKASLRGLPKESVATGAAQGNLPRIITVLSVAWLVGALAGVIKETMLSSLERAQERVQWGKPIIEHALVKRHLAGMVKGYQIVDALAFYLCEQVAKNKDQTKHAEGSACLMVQEGAALRTALELAATTTDSAVQIFGGFGYSLLSPIARHYLDTQALWTLFETTLEFDRRFYEAARSLKGKEIS